MGISETPGVGEGQTPGQTLEEAPGKTRGDAQVTTVGARVIISIEGRFDFNRHREFRSACEQALTQSGVRDVEVNLGGVDYIDSSGLGMLLMLRETAGAGHKTVTLCNCQDNVKQILQVANFGKLFPIA